MEFDYSNEELEIVLSKYYLSLSPLKLNRMPSKEKKRYLCLLPIVSLFQFGIIYTEKEVNEIIKHVYIEDYCMIRRYLVDYQFIERLPNGSNYWLKEKK